MAISIGKTEEFLHEKIPLSAAMGVRVVEAGHERLVLEAPLEPNQNHLGTAFGGSLNALATLAAYAMLWLELDDTAAHLVIAESSIIFLRPVSRDLRAVCVRPEAPVLAAFKEQFSRTGKARIKVEATLEDAGGSETKVRFRGTFVALR